MAFLNTELSTEIVLFTVNGIVSFFLHKSYSKTNGYINCLEEINNKGHSSNSDNLNGKDEYVMIQGTVKALGNTIPSPNVPNVFGVVQKMTTTELLMKRTSSGIWWDQSKLVHQSYNVAPFALLVDKSLVKVEDVLMANELHLDTVYNKCDNAVQTFAGTLWSIFSGVRPYGIQTTEEMLKEGTFVTGIGNLTTLHDGSLALGPPKSGKPFFITTQPLSIFLRDLKDKKFLYGSFLVVAGSLTLVFGSLLARRLWIHMKKKKERVERQRRLDERRRIRRRDAPNEDLPDALRCVVCQENPKEMILLPCGHLCVCDDCGERIGTLCPLCRATVESKHVAFL